jgi:cell division protein FtsZ
MLEFEEKNVAGARIKVIGIGGGGGNAINTMIQEGLEGVQFLVANTDMQALKANSAEYKIPIGQTLTRGLGAGANPEIGRNAALEDRDRLVESLGEAEMVFITAGMGGGTGTGAAPVIARIAREMGALTVAVVTKPFHFEGKKRRRQAEEGLSELRDAVDTLITIPNQRLLNVAGQTTTMIDTFHKADEVLLHAVRGISDLITVHGLINLDFADVRTIMAGRGMALMGTGEGTGDNRSITAAKQAISSPLLEDICLSGAQGVLINITSGPSLTLHEVNDASTIVQEEAHEEANIIFGAVIDEELGDTVRVTVIATGFEQKEKPAKISTQTVIPNTAYIPPHSSGDRPVIGARNNLTQPLEPQAQPNNLGKRALEKTLCGSLEFSSNSQGKSSGSAMGQKASLGQGIFGAAAQKIRTIRSGAGAGATRGDRAEGLKLERLNPVDKSKGFADFTFPEFREDEYDIPTFLRKQAD